MMRKILFIAAVEEELESAKIAYRMACSQLLALEETLDVSFMVTGIGTTGTTYLLTKALAIERYDLIVNIGIAGSFYDTFPLGTLVRVVKEQFGDVGIESRLGFQTLFEYEILDANIIPYKDGALYSPSLDEALESELSDLPRVSGVTVQTLSGVKNRVEMIRERFNPDIESMEGAAVFYVSLMEKVPFLEIRAVSNMIGERDKSKWNTSLALANLTKVCSQVLNVI